MDITTEMNNLISVKVSDSKKFILMGIEGFDRPIVLTFKDAIDLARILLSYGVMEDL